MDLLFEIIVDLLFEGSLEICTNKKISKWIRYPILIVLISFFTIVTSIIFILGIFIFNNSKTLSIILIVCSILILIGGIIKFRNIYNRKK